jgi:hypothetical protein
MSDRLQKLQTQRTCRASAVVVGWAPGASGMDPLWELLAIVAEEEATGVVVDAVVVRLGRREHADAAVQVVRWVAAHGRRPVLRTAVTLPRTCVEAARDVRATVLLEVADARPEVARALLGPEASPVAALLLQAQHLRALGIPTGVQLGPVLPGVHEPQRLLPLLRHVAAADLRHLHVTVGQLGRGRRAALAPLLGPQELGGLHRAFELHPDELDDAPPGAVWRLRAPVHAGLRHAVVRTAAECGLTTDACGCATLCHLEGRRRAVPVAVQGPDLFAAAF